MTKVTNEKLIQQVQLLHNEIVSRTSLLKDILDPRRDIDQECGYVVDPTAADYNDMYDRFGVARRVVHVLPEESWQRDPMIYETEDEEETEFEAAWKDLEKRFQILSILARADALSGIGRYGIVLLGVNDGNDLGQEVVQQPGRELLYLRVFDESVVDIVGLESDKISPRYGCPTQYQVTFKTTNLTSVESESQKVHWSRVVHLADNRRMSDVTGVSRLKPVFPQLQDLRKILGGSAEMFWQGGFPGISFEMDPEVRAAGGTVDSSALKEQVLDYMNGLQRYLATEGLHANQLRPNIADPGVHVEQQLRAIAITLGMPYRVFIGTEEGRLAGDQDSDAWKERIRYRQNKYITPYVIRPFVERCVGMGILPEPKAGLTVSWPDMQSPSEAETADVAAQKAEAVKRYVQGDGHMLIPERVFLREFLMLDDELVESIMAELEQQETGSEEAK